MFRLLILHFIFLKYITQIIFIIILANFAKPPTNSSFIALL